MDEAVKHKIKVARDDGLELWYVSCLGCLWRPSEQSAWSKRHKHWMIGRDTWDAAFALGVAHQKNA